jgi:beta-galactosidase
MAKAIEWMANTSGVKPKLDAAVPEGVDIYPREGDHGTVYILVNFAKTPQAFSLPTAMQDVLEGGSVRSVKLPVYGVAVLSATR